MTAPTAPLAAAIADIDATIARWRSEPSRYRLRIMRHVARALRCYPAWGNIRSAMIRRALADSCDGAGAAGSRAA